MLPTLVKFISICAIVGITSAISKNLQEISEHKFITRKEWNAREPIFSRPMKTPVGYVIISHSAGRMCDSLTECSRTMQDIQHFHMMNDSPDIGYNFVIGGDGNIYQGRGWVTHNFHMTLDTIGICFTGNFMYDRMTPEMIAAVEELLKKGVDEGKLTADYKLVAHNQTFTTFSPGDNVFKIIKNWTNYYAGFLQDKN